MLAFSIDYYGIFFRATQSVELFCTYPISFHLPSLHYLLASSQSSNCLCFSAMMVSAPAAFNSSRNFGMVVSGSREPHSSAGPYLAVTFAHAVTSFCTSVLSHAKPLAGETTALLLNSWV